MTAISKGRHEHHLDAVRALLMLLGIPYHAAMAYRAGHVWIAYPGEGAPVFTYLAQFIHLFRMPAFFIIAGYFAVVMLARRPPGEWLRQRFMRLGVPLAASVLTLVPLLNLGCELSNLPPAEALASWRHNSAAPGGYWVRHLWFLVILLYCSTAAALVAWRIPGLRSATQTQVADGRLAHHSSIMVAAAAVAIGLWEAISIELFHKAGLATNLMQQVLRLDELLAFAPFFMVGCILARRPCVRERLYRFSPGIALTAATSIGLDLIFLDAMPPPLGRFIETIAAVSSTQLIIALAKKFADRPHPVIERLVRASFVIYLVHLPIMIFLVDVGQHIAMPLMIKMPLIMLLTLALSYGASRFICASPLLRFLFDGAARLGSMPPRGGAMVARA